MKLTLDFQRIIPMITSALQNEQIMGVVASKAPQVAQYLPMLPGLLSSLSIDGLPMANERANLNGKGRLNYLLGADKFGDQDVINTIGHLLKLDLPVASQLRGALEAMGEVVSGDSETARARKAIDLVLRHGGGLTQESVNGVGDLLWIILGSSSKSL